MGRPPNSCGGHYYHITVFFQLFIFIFILMTMSSLVVCQLSNLALRLEVILIQLSYCCCSSCSLTTRMRFFQVGSVMSFSIRNFYSKNVSIESGWCYGLVVCYSFTQSFKPPYVVVQVFAAHGKLNYTPQYAHLIGDLRRSKYGRSPPTPIYVLY